MISINRRNLKIAGVIWGISLIVFVLGYLLVLKPQKSKLDDLTMRQNTEPINYDLKKKQLDEQIDNIKVQLGNFVINSENIQDLASTEIFNLAKDTNLDAFLIKPWRNKEVPAFKKKKYVYGQFIEVSFNATFREFAKFLNKLEMHEPFIFIDSFSIIRSVGENEKHKVEMNLAVLVEKQIAAKGT